MNKSKPKDKDKKKKVKPRAARDIPTTLPTGSEPVHPNVAAAKVFTGLTNQEKDECSREELLDLLMHERNERSILAGEFQRFKNALSSNMLGFRSNSPLKSQYRP